MADGILAAVNENGNIDRFIDTKGGVHYIEPKRYEESVAKIDAAATKAKETVNSATEAVSECKAQTGACTQETARAKEIADTVESRITGIEGDIATLRDSVSQAVLLLSEDLNVPGGKMRVEVYDMPAIRELVMRVSGNVSSTNRFFQDYYTTGKIPKDKLPSTSVNCALAQYEGTWGRFCARGCIVDDGRARLSLIAPQSITTGYTSECHISYAF